MSQASILVAIWFDVRETESIDREIRAFVDRFEGAVAGIQVVPMDAASGEACRLPDVPSSARLMILKVPNAHASSTIEQINLCVEPLRRVAHDVEIHLDDADMV